MPLAVREAVQAQGQLGAQSATHPVADHAAPDALADDQADPRCVLGLAVSRQCGQVVHHDRAGTSPAPAADDGRELGRSAHPVPGVQHVHPPRDEPGRRHADDDQADSSLRPLRRRLDRMARPARVRIRSRNPCVLARRRLFGWKVRLLTAVTPSVADVCGRVATGRGGTTL